MGRSFLIAVNVLITITVAYSRRNTPPVDACGFHQNSRLIHRFPEGKSVFGVQVIDKEVYVIRDMTPYIEVYDSHTFQSKRNISIKHIQRPYNLVQSAKSLFVTDWLNQADVTVVKLPSGTVTKWSYKEHVQTVLGLTGSSFYTGENILLTPYVSHKVKEFTPDGKFVSEVVFRNMSKPTHSIKMAPDRYAVCRGHGPPPDLHQVCLVYKNGETIKCYGGVRGSGMGYLNIPARLERSESCILVAEIGNRRVSLLNDYLQYTRDLISDEDLEGPYRLYLDRERRLLYVADNTLDENLDAVSGRVKVFKV